MERFLSEDLANRQYALLLDCFLQNYDFAALRSRFDVILSLAVKGKLGKQPEDNSFKGKIDVLFPPDSKDEATIEMNHRLNDMRRQLNTKIAHTIEDEEQILMGKWVRKLQKKDFKNFLSNVADLISLLSSVPIPGELRAACRTLQPVSVNEKMEVVFVMELFDNLAHLKDGVNVLERFKDMLAEKNRLGLTQLELYLIVYAPETALLSNLFTLDDFVHKSHTLSNTSPADKALCMAIDLLNGAIERWLDGDGRRPELIWMCHDFSQTLQHENKEKLEQMNLGGVIGFTPIAWQPSAIEQFKKMWPHCRPYNADPALAGNFFDSFIESIQRKKIKTNRD